MRRFLPYAVILMVLLLALGIGFIALRHRNQDVPGLTSSSGSIGATPPHLRGEQNAPAAIEEFGDFECMPCFILWPAMRNLEKDFGGRLSVTFREFPLPQHESAVDAARAAEAAGLQSRFWEMHDLLYLSRSRWVHGGDIRDVFRTFADRLGIDVARFEKDMDGPEVAKRIAADRERAASLGLDRTPALFLNGRRLQLQNDVETGIHADIDAALAKASH
ncbi:MAG: DsbA family protein [Verrucomicrobiota bacterium]|nr:DsbA family protein [Verrucomicrobiota bacterium]